jgi:transglutaminase-like putative cysteine protease
MATRARALAPLALAALSVAAAWSLAWVFDSGRFVPYVVAAACLPHAAGAFARRRRWPAIVGVGLALLALELIALWALVPATTWAGLPTASTFEALGRELSRGWELVRTEPAPAPVTDGALLLAMLATWTVAAAADWLAFGRHATLGAIAPALVLFVWASTLGTSEHATILVAAFALAAGGFLVVQNLAVLDQRRSWLVSARAARARWLLPAAGVGVVALLVAVVLAPALPGADREPLLDLAGTGVDRGGHDYSTQIPPLLDVSQKLEQPENVELFTVQSPERDYWRLVALDEFSDDGGGQWTLSAEGTDEVRDDLPRAGPSGSVRQRYRIGQLGERWLPAAYRPVAIDTPAIVVSASDTLVSARDTLEGLEYSVDSDLAPTHGQVTEAEQAATDRPVPEPLERYTELPESLPPIISGTAQQVVEGASARTPYAMAEALRDYFRSGLFTYDLNVDPSDGSSAIAAFLEERRGFCVQFASAYAVMARSLGIPARVAVGFTPGTPDGDVYTVRSHDAHAWPELWLDGLGWTHLFDPTPAAGSAAQPGGSSLTGDTEDSTPQREPPPPTLAPPATTPSDGTGTGAVAPTTTLAPLPARVTTREPAASSEWWLIAIAAVAVLVVLPALYLALVILAKTRRRARRRGAGDPAAAVRGAWEEALDRLHEARVPSNPALTPFEVARSAPQHGVTAATRPLRALARDYTVVRYGAGAPSPDDAERAWSSMDELDRALDTGTRRRERWRRRLDPSTLRRGRRAPTSRREPARHS